MLTVKSTILLLAIAFTAAAAFAQEQFDQITGIDNIIALRQRQIGPNHRQLIENVELKFGDTMLYADEVEVFTEETRIVARGNVALVQMANRITADSAEFNYKTRLGVFHTAYGIATIKPQVPRPGAVAVPNVSNQDTPLPSRSPSSFKNVVAM